MAPRALRGDLKAPDLGVVLDRNSPVVCIDHDIPAFAMDAVRWQRWQNAATLKAFIEDVNGRWIARLGVAAKIRSPGIS